VATLVSLNVGMPKDVDWQGKTVHTGIWKSPVDGARMVRRLNIDGDGQGDKGGHGGENRAVLVYQLDSYRHWRHHLGRDDLTPGSFGENFTVEGLGDDEVNIGDRYRIGEAEFEVTQPRVTCFRVGMRLGEPRMPSLLVSHRRPGFYLRVIQEGRLRAGDEIVRTRVGPERLSVATVDGLLYLPNKDRELLRRALDVPALSKGWVGSFEELLAAPAPVVPAWAGFRDLHVTDVTHESDTVLSIGLAGDEPLPAALPGQYLTVQVPDVGVRNYSLSSAPGGDYRISVKRESHGLMSGHLHRTLRPGATLAVAAPRGEFVLDTDADTPVVLLSAGIGITPVLAMLHHLAATGSARRVWWVHTTRGTAFAAEAQALIDRLPNARAQVVQGHLDAKTLAGLPADATAYVCGPTSFMADMTVALRGLGIVDVRTEAFGARSAINPGITGAVHTEPHQPAPPPDTGPRVTFARSGLTTRVGDHSSVLALAEACDVPTRWSCRTGVCHTCVTPVLAGTLTYTQEPLERPGDDEVLICCARPETDVVLDL